MRSRSQSLRQPQPPKSIKSVTRHYRPGKITRNPFLNFLRDVRLTQIGTVTELAIKAGEMWAGMNCIQKEKYYSLAKTAPPGKNRKPKWRRSISTFSNCKSLKSICNKCGKCLWFLF